MVGYDRDDLLSGRMRWTDLTPPEWRDQTASIVEEVKTTGIARPFEKEYFRKDGSRVPVLIGSAIFEQAGNQGVAFLLDLTERKQAEAEALESERRYHEMQMELAHANRVATMGQLTASIAHEVNHPIGATITNAEAGLRWLDRQPPQLDEVHEVLASIVKDGHRASNVVGRLRDLFTKTAPRMERLDINGAIADVIELTRSEIVKNGISTQMNLAEDLPAVEVDRTQLQQVMLNLIVNAVQALANRSDSGRELSISTSTSGPGEVLVSVCDSGPGISSEVFGRLFDPFYTTKPSGMGMGLSICHSIVEGHGGRIWATANDPQGAAFHFTLPAARQECAASQNADHR
jgi:PAS domain S-box-containing protein